MAQRKGGGALGRRKTNANTAGRKTQNSQWRGGFRPILHSRVRRRLPTSQGTALWRRHYSLNCVSLSRFGSRAFVRPEEGGVTPILAPKNSTDWDTTIDALGSHTMRISIPPENIQVIQRLLFDQCPQSRKEATARDALSKAGKLSNLTYVFRAGRYFVWRLRRLTELHNPRGSKHQNRTVGIHREFHAALRFWKWAIDYELLRGGEALSAPCYTAIQRIAKRH